MSNLKEFLNTNWLILAPMAGINDPVFRRLCIQNGALLTYTEMVSSKALSFKNEKTNGLLETDLIENKVVVQLFGHEPKVMAQQAKYVEKLLKEKLAYIDINMGCPAKKIVKKGDGAALMNTPKLAFEIVKACCNECEVPITVKFRKGYQIDQDLYLDFAKKMQKAGASAICVHGRYAMQFYKGHADINAGIKLSDALDIPVIWSGDVQDYKQAYEIKKNTNITGLMIGRASRGNPWVFSKNNAVSPQDKINTAKYHVLEYAKINASGLSHMRKHCMWYISGFPGASVARNMFSTCNCVEDYLNVFSRIEERIHYGSRSV